MTRCAFLLVLIVSALSDAHSKEVIGLRCRVDRRPVDGALREFTLKLNTKVNSPDLYDVTYVTKQWDRMQGKEISSTTEMIWAGPCRYNASQFVGACRQDRVDAGYVESETVATYLVNIKNNTETSYHFDTQATETYKRILITYVHETKDSLAEETEIEFYRDDCSLIEE